jgi:methenyltetrahydromethanopterin cyclohydrolase
MIERRDELRIKVSKMRNGCTLIDAGLDAVGGINAGLEVTKICLGGLADVSLVEERLDDLSLPAIYVATDVPAVSVLCCQYPLFGQSSLQVDGYAPILSGPVKSLLRLPSEIFSKVGYKEESDVAVAVIQSETLPSIRYVDLLASKAGVASKDVYLIFVPTNSMAGAVAARTIETSTWRLCVILGYDFSKVKFMTGTGIISPIYPGIWQQPGVTPDDMIHCAGRVTFGVKSTEKDDLQKLADSMVVDATTSKGKPFFQMLKEADFDFNKIEPAAWAVAEVCIYDLSSGRILVRRMSVC